jgi:hypothetical protein
MPAPIPTIADDDMVGDVFPRYTLVDCFRCRRMLSLSIALVSCSTHCDPVVMFAMSSRDWSLHSWHKPLGWCDCSITTSGPEVWKGRHNKGPRNAAYHGVDKSIDTDLGERHLGSDLAHPISSTMIYNLTCCVRQIFVTWVCR